MCVCTWMGLLQEQRVPLTTDPFLQLPQPKKKKKKINRDSEIRNDLSYRRF